MKQFLDDEAQYFTCEVPRLWLPSNQKYKLGPLLTEYLLSKGICVCKSLEVELFINWSLRALHLVCLLKGTSIIITN